MINRQMDESINRVIGMTIKEASEHLEKNGYKIRITIEDGRSHMVKGNIDMDRVNVIVNNGIIENIDKIG